MRPVVVIRRTVDAEGNPHGRGCWIWCPGCDGAHRPQIVGVNGDLPEGPCWTWNGCDDEHFGIEPSLLCTWDWGEPPQQLAKRCHSFIRDGQWQFLSDSTHHLAGQTVPMVPVPDWLVAET